MYDSGVCCWLPLLVAYILVRRFRRGGGIKTEAVLGLSRFHLHRRQARRRRGLQISSQCLASSCVAPVGASSISPVV